MKRGNHKIICADCLKAMKRMKTESVDLIITDPPYNRGIKYIKKYYKDRQKLTNYLNWLRERLREAHRILKKNGSMYLINYPELNARILPFLEDELKMKLRRWIIWNYPTNIGHSKKNWTRSHRSILFLVKGKKYTFNRQHILQHYKNPEVTKVKKRIEAGSKGRSSYDVLRVADLLELTLKQKGMVDVIEKNLLKNVRKEREKTHPCQIPPELLELLIKVSSNKGNIVFDPFAGTFSTSLAAKKLGRKSIGIEIAKKYYNIGRRKLRKN